jgi:hypothetical protein
VSGFVLTATISFRGCNKMGFGSYDESEQESANDHDEVEGESVTKNDSNYSGSDKLKDSSVDSMMEHL